MITCLIFLYHDGESLRLPRLPPQSSVALAMAVSTDAQTNLYLSHGRLSIDAECIGLGARTYKNHCAPVLIYICNVENTPDFSVVSFRPGFMRVSDGYPMKLYINQ